MKTRLLSLTLALALILAFIPTATVTAADVPTFPYVLGEPNNIAYEDINWHDWWSFPAGVINIADVVVVEYEGTIGGYAFSAIGPHDGWKSIGKMSRG